MNKISLIVIAMVMLIMCSGCSDDNLKTRSVNVWSEIVTDEETGVQYIIFHKHSGVTALPRYNPDGTIKVVK